jgi:hypothetical protein
VGDQRGQRARVGQVRGQGAAPGGRPTTGRDPQHLDPGPAQGAADRGAHLTRMQQTDSAHGPRILRPSPRRTGAAAVRTRPDPGRLTTDHPTELRQLNPLTNYLDHHWSFDEVERPPPVLRATGWEGHDRRSFDLGAWVWGVPPPGPLACVCEWPARQIPESRAEIDAAPVLEAAGRARPSGRAKRIWPNLDRQPVRRRASTVDRTQRPLSRNRFQPVRWGAGGVWVITRTASPAGATGCSRASLSYPGHREW